jgi:hypothetical protein
MTDHSHRDRDGLMMRRMMRIHWVIAAAIALVVALGGGIAYAYWATTGSGSGTASAGTMTISVEAIAGGDSPTGTLIPGGSADAIVRVNNPNSFHVTLTHAVGNGAIAASNGCDASGVSFTDQNSLAVDLIPGSTLVHVAGAVSMSTSVPSSCQGATFSIPVAVTVQT